MMRKKEKVITMTVTLILVVMLNIKCVNPPAI